MGVLRFHKRRGASRRRGFPWSPRWVHLRWLGLLILLWTISYGLYLRAQILLTPEGFPLRHIEFQGQWINLRETDLQQTVADYHGHNFLMLDIQSLHAVLATQPWIAEVKVKRRWPDTLEIHFQERLAFAYWGDDEMIDVQGQRFRPSTIREDDFLPSLMGPRGHERLLMETYQRTQALLEPIDLNVLQLVQDERRTWWMQLDNGFRVDLGRDQFFQRLNRFVTIYQRLLAERADTIATIDLRYTNGFTVKWKPSTASPG